MQNHKDPKSNHDHPSKNKVLMDLHTVEQESLATGNFRDFRL